MNDSIFMNDALLQTAVKLAANHGQHLRAIPELAFAEHKTTAYIRSVCEEYPVEIIDIGMETGLVCLLDAGCSDTVALRADIDAVPGEEGPKHLCGHYAHAGALLGAMHYLCSLKEKERPSDLLITEKDQEPLISLWRSEGEGNISFEKLTHNVLFLFQPAEEGTRGARAMLSHGLLEKVPQRPSYIFGIHNRPEVDCGDVAVHRGALMSEKSVFKVTFTGKPGHGSLPHKCIDPLVAAVSFVSGLQTIASRNTDPFKPVICTVNSISAGKPDVPAPENAVMTGYIRSFDHETHIRMEKRIKCLAENTAAAYECRCITDITPMVPPVINSGMMYEKAYKAAELAVGKEHIIDCDPCLASEDFAVFGTAIPSFLYWVGSGTPGMQNAPWHDPEFRIDPNYMQTAVPLLCASAIIP